MASYHSRSSGFAMSACFQGISALILLFLLLRGVAAQNRSDEVRALLDFKFSALADIVFLNNEVGYWSTWNESAHNPCAWIGVVCSSNFTVVALVFRDWAGESTDLFTVSLQPLSRLPDLRLLDFSSSYFILKIPESIGNLTGLERLDMSHNGLQGTIPASISNCVNLQYISLDGNKLAGEIPSLRGLVNLEILNLADNLLTGQFPKDLLELSSLVSIDLSLNMLNGSIPSLPYLTNLLHLSLAYNNFTKFEYPWLPPPRLKNLDVSSNRLEGMVPPSITNLSSLQTLNMSCNQLSRIPFGISQLLNQLLLDGPYAVSSIRFDLSQNQLSGNLIPNILPDAYALGNIGPSVYLNLSRNNLTGSIPLGLDRDPSQGNISLDADPGFQLPYHYDLDLSYNQLSGSIPNFFNKTNTSIDSLLLQNNYLSGNIVDFLLGTKNTEFTLELQFQNNLFTGDLSRITPANWKFPNLAVLDMSNCYLQMTITDTNPYPLGAILDTFMSSRSFLQIISLAGNNFRLISAPAYFTNVSYSLQVLDLSNLHLEGEISDLAFNSTGFPSLQLLNLSNNDLTGLVPPNIIKIPNLAMLDLANNGLSGPLPTIPPNSPFYNPSFFEGNAGLCGAPLPPCKQDSGSGVPWWLLLIILGGSMIIAMGSCLVATWRWRVYQKRHQQDADLITTLMDKESATLMALRELKKATNNFDDTSKIGEGGFGIVYKGKLSDGTKVAIKRSKREGSQKDKKEFLNEVRILSQVNHRHLVKLLGCSMENQISLLVFEFVSNGTLQDHLEGKFGEACLSWKQRLNIAIEAADALNYLHFGATFPIYHRDVKSANILLDEGLHAKVADFGISKLVPIEATHMSTIAIQGTLGYIDPEYYTSGQLSDKSDVYSFGVVLLELISAKRPIDFLRDGDETSLVIFASPYIKSGCLQQLIDPSLMETNNDPTGHGKESILSIGRLAMKCLDKRSMARPSMNEVWKELQNSLLEFESSSTEKDHNDDPQHGAIESPFESCSRNSSRLLLENSGSDIEMSQFSSLAV